MAWTAKSIAPAYGQVVVQPATAPGPSTPGRANRAPSGAPDAARDRLRGLVTSVVPTAANAEANSGVLNDRSLMGTAGGGARPGMTQVGSSIPVAALNSNGIPPFIQNPAGILGAGMQPYADLLSRLFAPQPAAAAIPPDVAAAYANAANAEAARTQAQTQAINAALALPGQAADLNMRANAMAPWSLSGLPTGLGYRDPLQSLSAQIFQTNAAMLPNSTTSQLAQASARGSGWTPALPMF